MHAPGGLASWAPSLIVLIVPAAAYALGAARWRRRRTRPWSHWRTVSWVTGLLLVATALSPPLTGVAHHDPRVHMVQHLLLGMYAPLALVLAAPVTLLLGASGHGTRRRVSHVLGSRPVHVLSHPFTAAVLTSGGMWVLFATPLYAASLDNPDLHHVITLHFVLSGLLFAWAVAGPDPAPRRPGLPVRLVALVLAAAAHAVLAKTLYARAGEWPPGVPQPVPELQQAAQLMYYGGDLAEVLLAVALFATWWRTRGVRRARASRPTPAGRSAPG